MNQFGPSTLINLSNFSSIKPEPASTPPQSSMANSTTVAKMPGTPSGGGRLSPESNQVLTKKKLQDLVREVDPNEQLDEDVEEVGSNLWKGLQKELIWDLSQISGPFVQGGSIGSFNTCFPMQPSAIPVLLHPSLKKAFKTAIATNTYEIHSFGWNFGHHNIRKT
uniref:Transcription initiation factor TFIID subunit 12 n=1 Tax=Ficedula albicollis TaxID=59894 RepID=A0A803V0D8_FICAL